MDLTIKAKDNNGLSPQEIRESVLTAIEDYRRKLEEKGRTLKKVLILPPDYTRFHSGAGFITNFLYHYFKEQNVEVDILPALGTHEPISRFQAETMFGDIPYGCFLPHDWRKDVVTIGEIPKEVVEEVTEGTWKEALKVEVNYRIMDPAYDLILSPGQVVPHEVIGMSNHAKNLFVGTGGFEMINKSHIIGAIYGMERMMGRDHTPVRKLFDYAFEHFLSERPVLFLLTVTTAPQGRIVMHGLFIGEGRQCLTNAVALAQEKNIDFLEKSVRKCVVYLDPEEFKSTWLGNKAVYRTRMMIADGGELLVLAPGIERFGEDKEADQLIRKYGYRGTPHTLQALEEEDNEDLRGNMSAAAHLIHGSSEGRFKVVYAVEKITTEEVRAVGYEAMAYKEAVKLYDPAKLHYGFNEVNGEEIYFIPNPALGLWIAKDRFAK